MESTSQTNNHGCFWYLFCCCLCDSSEDNTQQRVAHATDPLLKHAGTSDQVSIAPRQVTFDQSRQSPPRGILRRVPSDHSINGSGIVEQVPVHTERRVDEETGTPPRSPASDRSFGSNPNSPAHGYTAIIDPSQWGVVKGTSSPQKDEEKV